MQTVLSGLRPHLLQPKFLIEDPLGVYGIASILGFLDEARIAHRKTFEYDVSSLLEHESSAEDISGMSFVRILKHRQAIAARMTEHFIKIRTDELQWNKYGVPTCSDCDLPYNWLHTWEQLTTMEFQRRPSTDIPFAWYRLRDLRFETDGCPCSAFSVSPDWRVCDLMRIKDELDEFVEDGFASLDWTKSVPF
ncbi:hypothetical protein CALVIDRAFT_559550 [Calocera viscosa TUFC12733]|uniref:Uncharacterized protein n=1 Tax=Calocera viscosa (strain TUFC12733) TaxID=1330018 RepID=A0A167SBB6_CALVF|nr:hypothetical protein CALVIDRAFT_559550 [Calocera viscosa TUFC12733]